VKVPVRCSLNSSAFSTSVDANPPWGFIIGRSGCLYFRKLLVDTHRLPLLGDKFERWFSKD
jgi:hypothetical protein